MLISFVFYVLILSPLISILLSILYSYNLTKKALIIINLSGIFISLGSSIILLLNFILVGPLFFEDIWGVWFETSIISIEYGFLCDTLSVYMLFIVCLISSLVHLYSIEYMKNDPNLIKFLQYLSLFTLAMFILITSNNLIQMFIGWEGVGICSFLLINFWDSRIQANTSAIKAIIVNRIGDVCLLISFILIFKIFGTFDYLMLFSLLEFYVASAIANYLFLITLFLFLGAVGKSAQIFLHVWLPDAMEGPTPVSALIHAATMVTAGIFLIIRCASVFELVPECKKLILLIGGLTALFAGSTGMVQNDLKKVIAYSTCSQLGFMFVACGLGLYELAFFHLSMHAFFKALLFLSAGSIIHAFTTDEQDIRRMGGLYKILPITYTALLIGSLVLMGFPYTSGYYSKDLILEALFVSNCPISKFALITCLLATICTTFYSSRLIFLVFLTKTKISVPILKTAHESSIFMIIPLVVLVLFSIFGGYLFKDLFVGFSIESNNYLIHYRSLYVQNIALNTFRKIEELSIFFKLVPFFIFIGTSFCTFYYYFNHNKYSFIYNNKLIKIIYRFLLKKWYFDICFSLLTQFILKFSLKSLFFLGDRGFLEIFGPLGFVRSVIIFLKRILWISHGNPLSYFSTAIGFFIPFLLVLSCTLNFI